MSLLEDQCRSHRRPLHLDDMPSEILRQIFISTYPRKIFEPGSDISSAETIQLPRRLSHVSRRWRQETLAYGELWSYLSLILGRAFGSGKHGDIFDMFLTFLERTNNSPINFRLRINIPFCWKLEDEETNIIERMISELLERQSRWKDVNFDWVGRNSIKLTPGFRVEIFDTPRLKSLTLVIHLRTRGLWEVSARVCVSRASRIEEINLRGNYHLEVGESPMHELSKCRLTEPEPLRPDIDPDSLIFPDDDDDEEQEEQEELELELEREQEKRADMASTVLKVMELAPNLQFLGLSSDAFRNERSRTHDVGHPIFHRIQELDLSEEGHASMDVIDYLHLPELNKLKYGDGSTTKLLNFIQRSRPPLSCLTISCISDNSMLELLRLLPTLVELEISRYSSVSSLFHMLELDAENTNPYEHETILCPRLRYLRLSIFWGFPEEHAEIQTNALLSMLESRMVAKGTDSKVIFSEENVFLDELVEISPAAWDYASVKGVFRHGRQDSELTIMMDQ